MATLAFTHEHHRQRVVFGDGASAQVSNEVDRLGVDRVFVIGRARHGEPVAATLGNRVAGRWSEAAQHVPARLVDRAVASFVASGASGIVAVGGGSTLGLAKAVVQRRGGTILAIPTTYSGSESTAIWGRTDEGRKITARDDRVLPRTVIYDPTLLAGLPPDVVAASGFNALAHCLATAAAAHDDTFDQFALAAALHAAGIIADDLEAACRGDDDARARLLFAAHLAGRALDHPVQRGWQHRLAHAFGGSDGLPHAPLHAVLLPLVGAREVAASPQGDRVARAFGVGKARLPAAVQELADQVHLPRSLPDIGLHDASRIHDVLTDVERSSGSPTPRTGLPLLRILGEELLTGRARLADPQDDRPSDLTREVVGRFATTSDARLRTVLESVVEHLHGLVRDIGLTATEWEYAIRFLTDVGHTSDEVRQEFILLSDVLGVSSLVEDLAGPPAGATVATVLGPFHVDGSPERAFGESMALSNAGSPAVITGRVVDLDGRPIAGARLDVWQNAANRLYAVQDPEQPPHNLRGVYRTDPDGRFSIRTIRPVDYPIPDDGPVGRLLQASGRHPWRPAHVHFIVSAEGYRSLVTQIFDAGSQYLDSDAVFGVKRPLVRSFVDQSRDQPSPSSDRTPSCFVLDVEFVLAPTETTENIETGARDELC